MPSLKRMILSMIVLILLISVLNKPFHISYNIPYPYINKNQKTVVVVKPWSFENNCGSEKRKDIAYIKTHKTGSSTVYSILNLFSDINRLKIALPRTQYDVGFNWPKPFNRNTVDYKQLRTNQSQILHSHSVLNLKELRHVMTPNFNLITILRHPVTTFYSVFFYFHFKKRYHLENVSDPVKMFFQNTKQFFGKYKTAGTFDRELLLKDGQSNDLGYKEFQKLQSKRFQKFPLAASRHVNSNDSIEILSMDQKQNLIHREFLDYLDKHFHFVIIAELFDESLILLVRKFCWQFMDIVYQLKNVNDDTDYRKQQQQKQQTNDELRQKILKWNALDLKVYQHFKTKLENTIQLEKHIVSKYCQDMTDENHNQLIIYLNKLKENPENWLLISNPNCYCKKFLRSAVEYRKYFRNNFKSLDTQKGC